MDEKKWELTACTRRRFMAGVAGGALCLWVPRLAKAAAVRPRWPRITARDPNDFRILVVTDLHFFLMGVMADPQTVKDLKKMNDKFDPDLIMVTGDLWHNNPDGKGQGYLEWSCGKLGELETPWAFAWGNHDLVDDLTLAHEVLAGADNSLYAGGETQGNYRIEVLAPGSEQTAWNLIMLNDSDHGMKQSELDWFNVEAERIRDETPAPPPAFLFFHIPLRQYEDAAQSDSALGVMYEKVSHENGSAKALEAFKDSGMIRAMFCGHDHVNDYWGEVDGIHLRYARATGAGGYGGDRVKKGGTLIHMDLATGAYTDVTVFPNGDTWIPDGFVNGVQGD